MSATTHPADAVLGPSLSDCVAKRVWKKKSFVFALSIHRPSFPQTGEASSGWVVAARIIIPYSDGFEIVSVRKVTKSEGVCDSFPGEGGGRG
jgi:hypothetical protein